MVQEVCGCEDAAPGLALVVQRTLSSARTAPFDQEIGVLFGLCAVLFARSNSFGRESTMELNGWPPGDHIADGMNRSAAG